MVASRGGNDTACSFTGAELRNKVDAAAHFEGSHGLVVLVFYENFCANERVHGRIAVQGCALQVGTYLSLREQDIGEGWNVHCSGSLSISKTHCVSGIHIA